jgi:hypothetical protein
MTNATIGTNQSIRGRIVLAFSVRARKAGYSAYLELAG